MLTKVKRARKLAILETTDDDVETYYSFLLILYGCLLYFTLFNH